MAVWGVYFCFKAFVVDTEFTKRITAASFLKDGGESTTIVKEAAEDSYDRLIAPSVEREVRAQLFDEASEQAIKMFELNLKLARAEAALGNRQHAERYVKNAERYRLMVQQYLNSELKKAHGEMKKQTGEQKK